MIRNALAAAAVVTLVVALTGCGGSSDASSDCDPTSKAETVSDRDDGGKICLAVGGLLTLDHDVIAPTFDTRILRRSGQYGMTAIREGETRISWNQTDCPSGKPDCTNILSFEAQVIVG